MAEDRDSLLREVEEEIRREQMQKIWQRYSGAIIAAAVLVAVLPVAYTYWVNNKTASAEADGARFETAVRLANDKKSEDALTTFATIAADNSSGYSALAKLHIAGAQAKAGNAAEAVAVYEALAKSSSADRLLKDFATLQAASLRLADADFTEMKNRLTPLTAEGEPFKTSASELLGLAAFKSGDYDEARNRLEPLLIDPTAPRAIQERIKIVLAEIASTELAKVAPAPAGQTTPAGTPPQATPDQK